RTRLARLVGAAAAAAEQLHAAVHIHHDLGGVAFDAVLLPLAGLQASFDVALRALAQVLAGNLSDLAEQHHAVPLGALLQLTGLLVLPAVGGRQRDVGHRIAIGHVAGFRVAADIADQDDFIHPSGHG